MYQDRRWQDGHAEAGDGALRQRGAVRAVKRGFCRPGCSGRLIAVRRWHDAVAVDVSVIVKMGDGGHAWPPVFGKGREGRDSQPDRKDQDQHPGKAPDVAEMPAQT